MNYTTIGQSKKLVELGLNPDTADMAIVKDNTYCNALSAFNGVTLCQNYNEIEHKTNYIPCWSLGALLNLMPKKIQKVKDHNVELNLGYLENKCNVCYFDWTGLQHGPNFTDDSPLNATYSMVVWLLENGLIEASEGMYK